MSCLVVANALESGNDLDLDQTASRKGGNLEGAARGERGLTAAKSAMSAR